MLTNTTLADITSDVKLKDSKTKIKGNFDKLLENDVAIESRVSVVEENKLNINGDFQGTWNGHEFIESEPGLASTVEQHTSQLAENAKELKPIYNNNDTPIITFIDDDATSNFLSIWKPIADAKGIKISLGVVKDFVGTPTYMTLAQLQTLKNEGFDILSHSKSHPHMYNISDADWELQCSESLQFIKDNGFNEKAIVYPFGVTESPLTTQRTFELKSITKKYYQYGIDSKETTNYLPVDSLRIQRVGIGGSDLANIKSTVDKCNSRKNWLVILTHCGYETNTALYGDIIDYIQSLNIPILTFDEAIKRIGNSVSAGDGDVGSSCFISKDGKLKATNTLNVLTASVNFTTDKIGFMFKTVSVHQISTGNDTLTGLGGVLTTFIGDTNYTYQEYRPAGTNDLYKRNYNDGTGLWGTFKLIATDTTKGTKIGTTQLSTLNIDITTYASDQEHIILINTTGDTLTGKGGVVRLFRSSITNNSYMEFTPYDRNKNTKYMRKWSDSLNSWQVWQMINVNAGATASRPAYGMVGECFFDVTLGKPIWVKTNSPMIFVDATGLVV